MNYLVPREQHLDAASDGRSATSTVIRGNVSDPDGTPVDLSRLFLILRRRWWLVTMATLLAGTGAWLQVREQPRSYRATAVVKLLDRHNTLAGSVAKDDDDRMPAMYMTASEVEIVQSRAVANAVVDSEPLGLRVNANGFANSMLTDVSLDDNFPVAGGAEIPITFSAAGVSLRSNPGVVTPYGYPVSWRGVHFIVSARPAGVSQGSVSVISRDRAADQLIARLDATPRKQTNLIDIAYTAGDRLTAKFVVNRVARTYQMIDMRMAQQQLHQRRLFIEDQLARTDAQLAEADGAVSSFRSRQEAYSSQDKFKAQQEALAGVEVRRDDLDEERKMVKSLLRKFDSGTVAGRRAALSMLASVPGVSGDRSPVQDLYARLLDYDRSRAELISGPSGKALTHPEVQRMDTLIASTQEALIAAAQSHVALLDARIEALDDIRARSATLLGELPAAEATETHLQENADALRTQATALRTSYQIARIAEAAELGQVAIVDLATRASSVPLGRGRFVGFALFLGLLAGSALALILEGADRSVKRREDIEQALQVPVLATIPGIESNGERGHLLPRLPTGRRAKSAPAKRRKVALAAVGQSRSAGAQAFRHLGANIFYSRTGGSPRRILVTSPAEGDGKTSVAANLAITFAHQRFRVLLVDCDVSGRLHSIFQLPISPGVADVVLQGVHPGDVIRETGVAGLFVMTAGTRGEVPSDVIGSDRMQAMLRDMTHEFDIVVLDCSPVLALADSTILSVNSDAVLLVLRAGHTASGAAAEAMRHLSSVGARIAGVVLNDPDGRARQYADYYPGYRYAEA